MPDNLSIQRFEKKSCIRKRFDLYFPLNTGGAGVAASQSSVKSIYIRII